MGRAQDFLRNAVSQHEGDDCLLWPFSTNGIGYGRINNKLVHRIVCEQFHGAPPHVMSEAAHLCGVRLCCSPRHLSWKTHRENMADMRVHGTVNVGSRNGAAKLTEDDVLKIHALAGQRSQRQIARQFGVYQTTVRDVLIGKSWGHVRALVAKLATAKSEAARARK